MKTASLKPNKRAVFLFSFLLGTVLFIAIYGLKVVDPRYDLWIFDIKDPDIKQHYIGWCHFRKADWTFPLGLMNSLSWPFSISVLYTDSIPLLALFFKLFDPLLPETFQYLGLFGLISMSLTGGFAGLILYRLIKDPYASILGSAFFSLIPHLLQRMFFHTTLTAQWIILIPLYIWLSDSYNWTFGKRLIRWGICSLIAITIHPYLWMMFMIICFFSDIETFLRLRKPFEAFAGSVSAAIAGLIGLYAEGGFYGGVSAIYYAGGFESNLNSLFNPMGYGLLLPDLDLVGDFQYEGFGYLGFGILVMLLFSLAAFGVRLLIRRPAPDFLSVIKRHPRRVLIFIMSGIFLLFSVYPSVSLGDKILFTFPRYYVIDKFFGIFRSTGRFIWPVTFMIAFFAFRLLYDCCGRYMRTIVIALCLLLQFYDLSGTFLQSHEDIAGSHKEHHCDLDEPALLSVIDNYDHIVMLYDSNIDLNKYAYYAAVHSLTINRFYFSRDIDSLVDEKLQEYTKELEDGEPEKGVLYLFDDDDPSVWMPYDLHFYYLTGTIVGVVDPIPGLSEISE